MAVGDYALHAVKGLKESFDNAMSKKILEYKDSRLFTFETTTEFDEKFTSTEALSGSKKLSESETPPTLKLDEGYAVTLSDERFGGAVEVNEKMRVEAKDSTTKIDTFIMRQRNQLLVDNYNLLLVNIHKMFNEAFSSSSDYLAPDGVEICGTHSWNTSGASTWSNATTDALDMSAVDAAKAVGGAFTDAKGRPMPIDYDTIIVKKGGAASREAKKLFGSTITPAVVANVNIYEGEMTIIETPYITETNHWFMMDSKLANPLYVGINEMPQMREPIKQNNEAVRSNVTGFWKQGVNNLPFNLYGSDGTT